MQSTKSRILLGCLVLSSLIFWIFLRTAIQEINFSPRESIYLLLPFSLFIIFFCLAVLLTESKSDWYIAWAFVSITSLVAALGAFQLIASALLFVTGIATWPRVRGALAVSEGKTFFYPVRTALPMLLTVIAFVIATAFVSARVLRPNNLAEVLSEEHVLTGLRLIEPIITSQVPEFSLDATVKEYTLAVAKSQRIPIENLSQTQQDQLVNENIALLEARYSIDISPDMRLGELTHAIVISILSKPARPYLEFFPILTAFGLFLFLNFVFLFYRLFMVPIVLGILYFLRKMHIIEVSERMVSVKYPRLI